MRHLFAQLGLFGRHHLHLVSALLFSASLHYGLVHFWPQPSQKNLAQENLTQKNVPPALQHSLKVVLLPSTLKPAVVAQEKTKPSKSEKKQDNLTSHALAQPSNVTESERYSAYLSPNDVEMPALPVVNIDLSMLPQSIDTGDLQQKLPIQLRLYIDEFGQVARIERIGMVLAQDDAMASALEELLKNVSFTPAKREFTSVKSYQDVAFDFKSND